MAKTQAERLDEINTKLELQITQQRVVIQQNDKILEFVDAIYQSLAAAYQEAAGGQPEADVDHDEVSEIISALSGSKGEEKEPYWGYNRDQERKARQEAQNGD